MANDNWNLPGGKLREMGPKSLTEDELLAIIIGTGTREKSASQLAREILEKYGSLNGILNTPLNEMLNFKGLGDVKIIRIAAAIEIGRRVQE
jgi:DNA repair protein RadC